MLRSTFSDSTTGHLSSSPSRRAMPSPVASYSGVRLRTVGCGFCVWAAYLEWPIELEESSVGDHHEEVSLKGIDLDVQLAGGVDDLEHLLGVGWGVLHVRVLAGYYNRNVMLQAATLLMLLAVAAAAAEEGTVALLKADALQNALEDHQHLVLYFAQDDCKHCQEFSEAYALVAKLHADQAAFFKLSLSPSSLSLFETHEIDSTPTVLAFSEGEVLPYRFEPTGTGNAVSVELFKWVERMFSGLASWEGEEGPAHQLIVQCHSQQFADFWQEVSRNELWLDVYCGTEELLRGSLAIVHENGRQVEAWQMENDFQQVSAKLRRLIRAYKYKYTLAWSDTLAHEVFRNNASAFLLIVNNDSRSRDMQTQYEQIKKDWYENSHSYEPTVFAVADLVQRPYDTLQLKRFLTGHASFYTEEYIYPILGFIARGEHEAKYVVNITAPKNTTTLQEFIANIEKHVIRNEPYEEAEEDELAQWFNENTEFSSKKSEEDVKDEKEVVRKILTQSNWNDMLTTYEKPFFVYFTWRHSHRICQLEREFTSWWEGSDHDFAPHRRAYDVFLHMHHVVDLPVFPSLTLQYFPSLFYFSPHKDILKLEGVTNLNRIKQFINQTYTKEAHH